MRLSMQEPLPFSVRVSPRAKWASLRMSVENGLVVVVPRRYDLGKVPALVESKRQWVEKHQRRFEELRSHAKPSEPVLPIEVVLPSMGERWVVRYENRGTGAVKLKEQGHELVLIGNTASELSCRRVLRRWLLGKGKQMLIPWLFDVSRETGIPFRTAAVRLQRSRWGSCSPRGTISLNARLLFLAPELVRYLFIHELCHRLQMNHSRRFWACVAEREPRFRELDHQMRTAMRTVPRWSL